MKRFVSLILSSLFVLSLTAPALAIEENDFDPNAQIVSEDFYRFDPKTGEATLETISFEIDPTVTEEVSPGYFPNSPAPEPNGIIGPNNIMAVDAPTASPYSTVVSLQITHNNGATYIGSGFVIGPHAIVTAAHCLYSPGSSGGVRSIKVAPARQGDRYPYGYEIVYPSSFLVNKDYINGADSKADWGIIELSTDFGSRTGWCGLYRQDGSFNGNGVQCVGYPTTYNGASTYYAMYKSYGTVRYSDSITLQGDWDCTGGFSGGPLLMNVAGRGTCVVGINRDGSSSSNDGRPYPTAFTGATRLTPYMFQLFSSYR